MGTKCRARTGALAKFLLVKTAPKFWLPDFPICALSRCRSGTLQSMKSKGAKCGWFQPTTVQELLYFWSGIVRARPFFTQEILDTGHRCWKTCNRAAAQTNPCRSIGFTWTTHLAPAKRHFPVNQLHTPKWVNSFLPRGDATQRLNSSSTVTLWAKRKCFGTWPNNSTPRSKCSKNASTRHFAVVWERLTFWRSRSMIWCGTAQCLSLSKQWEIYPKRQLTSKKRKTSCTYA